MAAGNSYCLGIKSNDFFLKDNKKAFILWLNVPKVTAYKRLSVYADMSYQVITSEFMGGVAGTGMSVSSGSNGFFGFNVGVQVDLGKSCGKFQTLSSSSAH